MNTVLNRPALKAQARELLRTAQVSPKAFMVLYYSVLVLLDVLISFLPSEGLAGMFITTLSELLSWVLGAGLVLYFMGIRRRERMEFATLFDGFSFAGKLIALNLVVNAFTALWSLLLVFPGFIAFYRYRFAAYNLYENPDIGIFEALDRSKRQTRGMKMQLFNLDLSYFGWIVLAALPNLIVNISQYISVGGDVTAYLSLSTPLPLSLLCTAWSFAVALFYLPNWQCVLLDYYDAAKAATQEPPAAPDFL